MSTCLPCAGLCRSTLAPCLHTLSIRGSGTFDPYRRMVRPRLRARFPPPGRRLFNSGVLVMDLVQWRSQGIPEQIDALLPLFAGINGEQLLMNLAVQEYDHLD